MATSPRRRVVVPRKQKNKTLSDLIIERYAISRFDSEDKHFLPAGTLTKLVTLPSILKELDEDPQAGTEDFTPCIDPYMQEVADFVGEKATILFATAVDSGLRGPSLSQAMLDLKYDDITDGSLPIEKKELVEHYGQHLDPWSSTRIHNFCQEQWRFLAPVFSLRNPTFDLKYGHILPFISKSSTAKEGAFGQVFSVEIHEAHQDDLVSDVSRFPASCFFAF